MSVKTRMKNVIASETPDRYRYVWLKEATGISSDIWKNFWFDRREPDAFMLEALSKTWPQYAFWLATGITDPERGHVAPPLNEGHYPIARGIEQVEATEEFKYLLNKSAEFSNVSSQLKMRDIEDAIFDIREKLTVPAVFVSYEKVMRELGEGGKAEFFLIETDKELSRIRTDRSAKEKKLQKQISDWRKNLQTSQSADKVLSKIRSWFIGPSEK